MKHVRRGGGSGGAGAPGGDVGIIDDADTRDYGPPPVHDEHDTHAPHPTAMLAYVDHDHEHDHARKHEPDHKAVAHHDQKLTPEQQAAIDKALATTKAVTQQVLGIAAEEKVKGAVEDTKAIAIGAQLALYSRGMTDTSSRAFIQTLDSLDDPELRHKVMAQFEQQTGQKLDAFIKGCNKWNNNGDNRDKAAALQLISPERDKADQAIADMKPEDREKARQQATEDAKALLLATNGKDHSDANSQKIFRLLEKKTPAEIEMLRTAMRAESNQEFNLYERIDYGMHKGDEDEAVAMLAGDHVSNARMALINEDDPKRLEESIGNLSDAERKELKEEPFHTMALQRIKNPSDRAVVEASIEGNKDLAEGERLGNLLKPKDEGMVKGQGFIYDEAGRDNYDRRKANNVLTEFEGMSGEQVKAAVAAWDKAHPDRPMMKMLEDRWGNDDDKTELNRLKAMMEGDKGKDRSLRLEESMRNEDQDEREAALRHEKTDEAALHSKDDKVRKHAEEVKAENDSFERNNVEADHNRREVANMLTGRHDDTTGHSTKEQLQDYFATQKAKDVKMSYAESLDRTYGQDAAADAEHAKERAKHEKSVDELDIQAMELLDDGKFSPATEFRRGKGDKEKAEALENINSNKELEAAAKDYKEKYGEDMLPDPKKDRSDMNANELSIDNVRRYGARAERPAQVEAMLQIQQYEKQKSSSLEYDEEGRGTQEYQRILMEKQRQMLKDPKFAVHAPKFVDEVNGQKLPFPQMVEDPHEPTFEDTQAAIDNLQVSAGGDIHQVDDGLKDGVKKAEFTAVDKQLVKANAEQEGAKKRLAERYVKIFSMIAKIAAVLTANPWLIAAIDIAEGLIEMGIKHEVMGEAYDPADDLKALAITGVADIALLGFSKLGELKGAARLAESEAVSVGEKAAIEVEHATTAEAKSEAVREGAHVVAGEENAALHDAIEEGGSAEKALGNEVANEAEHKVEQKAAETVEGKAVHEADSAAAKAVEGEATQGAHAMEDAEKAAEQLKSRYGMIGGGAKMVIQTVGNGIAQGKSPTDILKGLLTGGAGLMLPGPLAEKVRGAIGNANLAAKVLGEISGFGTEVLTNTTISVAGGAEGGDALFDSALGAGGARAQRAFGGHHGTEAPTAEEEHAPAVTEQAAPAPGPAPEDHAATPVAEEHAPVLGGRESPVHDRPMMGSADAVELGGANTSFERGESEYRAAANSQEVIESSNDKLAHLDDASRAQHAELFTRVENRGQQVLLERAIASGRSQADLELLVTHMSGKSEAEVMLEYSGAGLVQFYQQSCVPAAYQIALAERDPLWALHFKQNPEDVMNAQRNALIIGDAKQTQRDLTNPPEHLKAHVEDPGMAKVLHDPERYSDEGTKANGIDPADMKGTQLHSQLEEATGSKYEVLTEERYTELGRADGRFALSDIPHDRIAAAVSAQKPVLIGGRDHEMVIMGQENRGGRDYYIINDPRTGETLRMPKENLLGMELSSVTLPKEETAAEHAEEDRSTSPDGPASPTLGVAAEEREAFMSAGDPLREKYGPARESHPEEYAATLEALRKEGVEIDFRPGSLAYSPEKDGPGRFIFDPEGSISALRHEYQHFLDIKEAGFPGLGPYMEDPKLMWAMEYRAYMKEIEFCRKQGDFENARKILEIMKREKRTILGLDGGPQDSPSIGMADPTTPSEGELDKRTEQRKRVVEVFTGNKLDDAAKLHDQHPDAEVIAAEKTMPPGEEVRADFEKSGDRFLEERFAESLPEASVDHMYARFPLPHSKGVENSSFKLQEILAEEMKTKPPPEALAAAVKRLEGEVESVQNLGPHALEKLVPGGTLDVIYWEKEVGQELRALGDLSHVDPSGDAYRFEVTSGPDAIPRDPDGGFGIPKDVTEVFRMILQKGRAK